VPSSWPAWASALGASLALGVGGAPSSVTLAAAPSIVRADGNVVAAVVPGNRKGRCASIVLWRIGRAPETIPTIAQCDDDGAGLDSVAELALGGRTVAWQETNGGNNLELIVREATLARPEAHDVSYVENGGGAAGDPAGDWTGSLVGHGSLLAFASWTQCDSAGAGYARACAAGLPEQLYDQALDRIGGGVVRRGPGVLQPVWTDGKAILVRHTDGSLVLLDARGRVVQRFAVVRGLVGAVFQGAELVTLTPTTLSVWNARTGSKLRSFSLAPGKRVLEDLDGGVAVLGSRGTTHLIRLSDGRGQTFSHAAHAQLEPQGLVLADGRTLRFVPRSKIRLG
jgi:hypothetical protein